MNDGLATQQFKVSDVSGAQSSHTTGSFVNLVDGNGALESNAVGSPTTFGAFVQGVSVATSAGSVGTIVFGTPYTNTSWFATATAGSLGTGAGYISGARNISGATFIGDASTTYNVIAVGI